MTLPHNVEKSAFRRGEYVCWDGQGHRWHARRAARAWAASPAPSNPAMGMGKTITGSTLTEVAQSLFERKKPAVVEPF